MSKNKMLTFRVSKKDKSMITRLAKIYKNGNMSRWLLEASLRYDPSTAFIVK